MVHGRIISAHIKPKCQMIPLFQERRDGGMIKTMADSLGSWGLLMGHSVVDWQAKCWKQTHCSQKQQYA